MHQVKSDIFELKYVSYNKILRQTSKKTIVLLEEREIDHTSRRIKKMVAMYDYDPQEISPNVDAEVRYRVFY